MINWIKRYFSIWFLIGVVFLACILFFNDNSAMKNAEVAATVRDLEARIAQCEDTLHYYEALNRRLDAGAPEMERIVREHYHMQRPSEDVYIFD